MDTVEALLRLLRCSTDLTRRRPTKLDRDRLVDSASALLHQQSLGAFWVSIQLPRLFFRCNARLVVTIYDLLLVRVLVSYAVVENHFHAMVAYPVTLQWYQSRSYIAL